MSDSINKEKLIEFLTNSQSEILNSLAKFETNEFIPRPWKTSLGEGIGYIIEEGEVFERAGINFSQIASNKLPASATDKRPELANKEYFATGLSVIVHPQNPFVPTVHMNLRFFATKEDEPIWWYGGGMDLSPYYGFVDDCVLFHQACRDALDPIDESLYPKFKENCDKYFYLQHRQHMRGIGGVFFDDYDEGGFNQGFNVISNLANAFIKSYSSIVEKRYTTKFTEKQRNHQLYRRGRYVEFNLLQDRGTLFGLQTGGNIDSILVSLPPLVKWDVLASNRDVADDKDLLNNFLQAKDWLAIK